MPVRIPVLLPVLPVVPVFKEPLIKISTGNLTPHHSTVTPIDWASLRMAASGSLLYHYSFHYSSLSR